MHQNNICWLDVPEQNTLVEFVAYTGHKDECGSWSRKLKFNIYTLKKVGNWSNLSDSVS